MGIGVWEITRPVLLLVLAAGDTEPWAGCSEIEVVLSGTLGASALGTSAVRLGVAGAGPAAGAFFFAARSMGGNGTGVCFSGIYFSLVTTSKGLASSRPGKPRSWRQCVGG